MSRLKAETWDTEVLNAAIEDLGVYDVLSILTDSGNALSKEDLMEIGFAEEDIPEDYVPADNVLHPECPKWVTNAIIDYYVEEYGEAQSREIFANYLTDEQLAEVGFEESAYEADDEDSYGDDDESL